MTTANTNARAIDALREEIDTLDQELLALMEKRLDLAAAIAAAKSDDMKTEDANEQSGSEAKGEERDRLLHENSSSPKTNRKGQTVNSTRHSD